MSDMPIQPVPPAERAPGGDVVREQDKIMLVLAYFGLLALIPLLTVKDSEYVKWHAKQGLALVIAFFAWCVGGSILGFIMGFIGMGFLGGALYFLGFMGLLAIAVVAIIKAFEPTRWRIPVVSLLADKF